MYSSSVDNRKTMIKRRQTVCAQLDDQLGLIMAGSLQPRNFKANSYGPFRASSHFLYFVGQNIPEAVYLLDKDGGALYLPAPNFNHTLWHGPSPTFEELSDDLGCPVLALDQLSQRLKGERVLGLPQAQAETRSIQEALLGRPFDPQVDAPLIYAMINARLINDQEAINELREAAKMTAEAHLAGMRATRAGVWCEEIRSVMEAPLTRVGMSTAYSPIITSCGEVLHNHEYHTLLHDGDLLLVDFGAETRKGWAGDVTRTWPVSGHWSPTQRDIYDVVLQALLDTTELAHPGVEYRSLHAQAVQTLSQGMIDLGILKGTVEEVIEHNSHALFFPHGVGHLLGLDVHDMEDLGDFAGYSEGRRRSERFGWGFLRLDRVLSTGMAITVEPGFYQVPALLQNPQFAGELAAQHVCWERLELFKDVRGIRIEDDLLITEHAPEILSGQIPKEATQVSQVVSHSIESNV